MLMGYARVATFDQTSELEIQHEALRRAGCTQLFYDIDQEVEVNHAGVRQGFHACLRALASGDRVVVRSLDRLGLGSAALAALVARLGEENRGVRSLEDDIDTLTPVTSGWPVLGFCHSLREMEEVLEQERRARRQTTLRKEHKGGRKPALSSQQTAQARDMHRNQGLTVAEVCRRLGISRTTFYRSLNRSLS